MVKRISVSWAQLRKFSTDKIDKGHNWNWKDKIQASVSIWRSRMKSLKKEHHLLWLCREQSPFQESDKKGTHHIESGSDQCTKTDCRQKPAALEIL